MKLSDLVKQTPSKAVDWQEGTHTVRVNVCKEITTRDGRPLKVVEAEVVTSDGGMPEGVMTNYYIDENAKFDYGTKDMANFLKSAALGLAKDNPDVDMDIDVEEFKGLIFGEENILAGTNLIVNVFRKKSGYLKVNWL